MMKLIVLSLVLWASVILADPVPASEKFHTDFDAFVTKHLRDNNDTIEPLKISPIHTKFHRKFLFTNITASAGLDEIAVAGLSTLKRSGPSSLEKTKWGNIEFKVQLSLGVLNLRAVFKAAFMGITYTSEITGRIGKIDATAVIHYHPPTSEVFLKQYSINELTDLTIKTKGPSLIGLTNAVNNAAIDASIKVFKPIVRVALERASKQVIAGVIRENEFVKDLMNDSKLLPTSN